VTDDGIRITVWRHTSNNVWKMAAEISKRNSFRFSPTFNDSGDWELVTPYDSDSAALVEPKVLTLIEFRGVTSTWRNISQPSRNSDGETVLTVTGDGALSLLGDETAWRDPGSGLGGQPEGQPILYSGSAGQVVAALVNDNYIERAGLPLAIPTITNLGTPSRARSNFMNLQELVVTKANAGGIGVDVGLVLDNDTTAHLELMLWVPVDRSANVYLSESVGSLGEWNTAVEPPTLTHAIVSGVEGDWTLVTTADSLADAAIWGEKWALISGPQSYDAADIVQAGEEALTDGKGRTNVALNAIDSSGLMAFRDYNVGEKATATLDIGLEVVDVISSISVTVGDDGFPEIVPTFGKPDASDPLLSLADVIRAQDRRIRSQEQRG